MDYDPFSAEAMRDPRALYRQLREEGPVHYLPRYDAWVLPRFEEVWQAFLDRDACSVAGGTVFTREDLEARRPLPAAPVRPLPGFTMLDAPLHPLLRQALAAPFLKPAMSALAPRVRTLVRERLAALLPRQRFDLNVDLASAVSGGVACHLVGLGPEVVADVVPLVNRAMERQPGRSGIDDGGWQALGQLQALLVEHVARRRRGATVAGDPRLLDALLQLALPGREALDDGEIAGQLINLVIGGTESLPKVITGGLLALWQSASQRAEVAADPAARCELAFDEMVRCCAPAQWFGRTLARDHSIAGQPMRAGQRLLLLVASAQADEREFDDAATFRWDRRPRRVLAFGLGAHFCIGLHVARLEGRILLEELLRAVPEYDLDVDAGVRAVSEFQIGWTHLPLQVNGPVRRPD